MIILMSSYQDFVLGSDAVVWELRHNGVVEWFVAE